MSREFSELNPQINLLRAGGNDPTHEFLRVEIGTEKSLMQIALMQRHSITLPLPKSSNVSGKGDFEMSLLRCGPNAHDVIRTVFQAKLRHDPGTECQSGTTNNIPVIVNCFELESIEFLHIGECSDLIVNVKGKVE